MIKIRGGQTLDKPPPRLPVSSAAASSNKSYCKIKVKMVSKNGVGWGKKGVALQGGR